jgi:hypothetical protein
MSFLKFIATLGYVFALSLTMNAFIRSCEKSREPQEPPAPEIHIFPDGQPDHAGYI